MADILLALGGNIGDPRGAIKTALAMLEIGGVRIEARSPYYRTAPWGMTDQPPFINMCAQGITSLQPAELLELIQRVEQALGRERSVKWGPRTIDIDILAYGDLVSTDPNLELPHPRIKERAFVLVPLADIAPDYLVDGVSVRERAAAMDISGVEKLG